MTKVKDGFWKQLGSKVGSNDYLLKAAGGYIGVGNSAGEVVPLNNGTLNSGLNADKLDGYHLSDLEDRYVNVSGDWMNDSAQLYWKGLNGSTSTYTRMGYYNYGPAHAVDAHNNTKAFYIMSNGYDAGNDWGGLSIDDEGVSIFGAGDPANNFTGVFRVFNEDNFPDGPQFIVTKNAGSAVKYRFSIGQNTVNTSYNLYVNGTSYLNGWCLFSNTTIIIPVVSYTKLIESYGLRSDYTSAGYPTDEFLKAWCKYAYEQGAGYVVHSYISPSSRGYIVADIYASGLVTQAQVDGGGTYATATVGLPIHITGRYYPHGGSEVIFGTSYGTWYYRTGLDSGNYTGYLGYIGTTAVQASSANQAMTGITSITGPAGNINFGGNFHIDATGNWDTYINYYTGKNIYMCAGTNKGKVGIRTTSPREALDVYGASAVFGGNGVQYPIQITRAYNDSVNFLIGSAAAGSLNMRISNNSSAGNGEVYIDLISGGVGVSANPKLGVNTSTLTYTFNVAGKSYFTQDVRMAGGYPFYVRDSAEGWNMGIFGEMSGNDCMTFVADNAVTSFMFCQGQGNLSGWTSGKFNSVTPAMQIKNNSVYINKLLANGVSPVYKLYVEGTSYLNGTTTVNANTYVNGLLYITANGQTMTLGSQNDAWGHIETTAANFYFNKSLYVTGHIYPYNNASYNLGGTSNRWNNLCLSGYIDMNGHGYIQSGRSTSFNYGYTLYNSSNDLSNSIGMFSGPAGEEGGIVVSPDGAFLYNSSDCGWNFQCFDKDLGGDLTANNGSPDEVGSTTRTFGIRQSSYVAWSRGGFQKNGSDNTYVLEGGGGHYSLNNILHGDSYGTMEGVISDCNSVSVTGIYSHSGFSNRPDGVGNWGTLFNLRLYNSNNSYHRQLFFDCYSSDKIWTRSDSGGSWTSWKELITSANIGSQSVNYANSAGNATNADKLDNIDSTGFLSWTGMSASGGSSAPFQTSVDFFNNTANLNAGARMIYNYPGNEYTILYTRRSDATGHGSILRWGYPDNYIRMIRMISGSPQTSDWEKISAGYADSSGYASSAGNADTVDGYHASSFSLSSHNHDGRYSRTHYSFAAGSDNANTTCTDLGTWISRLNSVGGISNNGSISVGAWWWLRSTDLQVNDWNIRTSGGMTIYGGSGNFSSGDYHHFLILDAYSDLYGITSNETSWKYYRRFLNNGNYTDYTVTKTGGGASGTWGISITGNAATATSASSATQATNLLPENTAHYFRDPNNSSWRGGMIWGSGGTESMSFVAVNSGTRFQFVGGSDIANWNGSTWQSVTPYLTIYSSGIVTSGSATATGFIKSNSSDSYVLLGGGGHKALSDFSMTHSHPYLPLSGGYMNTGAQICIGTTSKGSSDVYNGGIQLREATFSTTSCTDNMYDAPGITFHWGGWWVHKLNMHSNALYWDNSIIITSSNISTYAPSSSVTVSNSNPGLGKSSATIATIGGTAITAYVNDSDKVDGLHFWTGSSLPSSPSSDTIYIIV